MKSQVHDRHYSMEGGDLQMNENDESRRVPKQLGSPTLPPPPPPDTQASQPRNSMSTDEGIQQENKYPVNRPSPPPRSPPEIPKPSSSTLPVTQTQEGDREEDEEVEEEEPPSSNSLEEIHQYIEHNRRKQMDPDDYDPDTDSDGYDPQYDPFAVPPAPPPKPPTPPPGPQRAHPVKPPPMTLEQKYRHATPSRGQSEVTNHHDPNVTLNSIHSARAERIARRKEKYAKDVENQRDAQRRFSILNVLDPSNVNAREEQESYGFVLPPSSWGDGTDIVLTQQRRHDHLRPITGAPALNGVFLGAANFVEHIDLGYANVAGAPPTKVKGEMYTTALPSDLPWGMSMGEDEARPGVVIVFGVAEESPSFHMDIRPGDRLLGIEGNYFKNAIDMGVVTSAISTFKRQKAESGSLVQLHFERPPPEIKMVKNISNEKANALYSSSDGTVQQNPVVAVCEKYAHELRRVFMAYALTPTAQVSNNVLTYSGSFDGRHFNGWGETRSLVQSGCMMNKIKIREFVLDFDLAPSLISIRATMRILRHVLKQDFRGGDGVGAPLQLLVGGDSRFMTHAPSVHQPTPSQRQAKAAELDKNHGVSFPEFIELLAHIADAARSREKWSLLYPTTEDMLEGMFVTWGICDEKKMLAAKMIRQRKEDSVFRYC